MQKYEVYCDESCVEAFYNKNAHKYAFIGGIWLPSEFRQQAKQQIQAIKQKYSKHGEMKWNKVTPNTLDMYKELIQFFFQSDQLRFRVICIQANKINNTAFNAGSDELGFYKFYFQLIQHWLKPSCAYTIFLDHKINGYSYRIKELKTILQHTTSAHITQVQAVQSAQSPLIQLADVLIGAVAYKFNGHNNTPKIELCQQIEQHIGHELTHTSIQENKFNVFDINLREW